MKEMIKLKDVCLDFGDSFSLHDVSFDVMQGEIFGFLGPSGAGKTTTMKLLTKQLKKKSGMIRILGKDIGEVVRDDYENIGILSDNNELYERMSIEDNLNFLAGIRNVDKKEVTEILKKIRLYDSRKTVIKKCSKGMRQRATLAAAILHKPDLLFLDEPTSGLDPATVQEVHKMLVKLNEEGTTIFLTTHNMEEADKLCGRVGIINQGKIVEIGSPRELKLLYAREEIEVLTADRKVLVLPKNKESGKIILDLLEAGNCLTIHTKEPNLEEIFLQLTGREF